jgi:hypothetical protein
MEPSMPDLDIAVDRSDTFVEGISEAEEAIQLGRLPNYRPTNFLPNTPSELFTRPTIFCCHN